jgi:hypothetical protein
MNYSRWNISLAEIWKEATHVNESLIFGDEGTFRRAGPVQKGPRSGHAGEFIWNTRGALRQAAAPLQHGDAVKPRVLIAIDDDVLCAEIARAYRQAGMAVEDSATFAAACDAARSGRFPVVVAVPVLKDGSWKRLLAARRH